MLGRLQMTEDECLQSFKRSASNIFSRPRLLFYVTGTLLGPKYGNKSLMSAADSAVKDFNPFAEDQMWKMNIFASPADRCRT